MAEAPDQPPGTVRVVRASAWVIVYENPDIAEVPVAVIVYAVTVGVPQAKVKLVVGEVAAQGIPT